MKMTEEWRYERKFVYEAMEFRAVEMAVRFHPFLFREVFSNRWVNSLYLDTPSRKSAEENLAGLPHREKIRVRWYGELQTATSNAWLERKVRENLANRKERFLLEDWSFRPGMERTQVFQQICVHSLPEKMREKILGLEFSALTRYQRHYFESADGAFRLTLDSAHEFYALPPRRVSLQLSATLNPKTIMEMKYGLEKDALASKVMQFFPARLSRNSKYLQALGTQ